MDEKSLQSTSPIGAADYFGTLTTMTLVLIAIGMIAAIAIIVWGTRRWAKHRAAMREMEAEGLFADPVAEQRVAPAEPAAPAPIVAPLSETMPQPGPAVEAAPVERVVAPAPVEAPAPIAAPPVPLAPVAPVAPSAPVPGDAALTRLKGLGPKVAARLGELGITRIDELAALDEAAAADLDARLGNFSGRMARDQWIEQARLLHAGDIAGYEARFGKLG